MHILFTQSNRLSCPIEGASLNPLHPQSVYDTLVLPGNTFTGMQRTVITQSALSYHSVTIQTTLNQSSVNKLVLYVLTVLRMTVCRTYSQVGSDTRG